MLNEAGETIGQDPFYWYFSASLALRENDLSAARAAIHRALKLAPNDPAVLFEAGHVAESTGDDDQARIYWQQAAAADPNGPIGRDAAKAVEMLGVTPALKGDPPPAPKSR
jgi:Flp pilus assembly protein TadD